MKNKVCRILSLVLVIVVLLGGVMPSYATPDGQVAAHDDALHHDMIHETESYALTNTLYSPGGMQGFEGDHAILNPNEMVEIGVEFRTPSTVALQLMYDRGYVLNHRNQTDSFEAQALFAHEVFQEQLEQILIPFAKNTSVEILSEHYWLFNGIFIRVPGSMVEQIASLPEVYSVFPNVTLYDEPVDEPIIGEWFANESFSDKPFTADITAVDHVFMRETREHLRMDYIHNTLGITGAGVQVAVLDRGICYNPLHPEFERFLVNGRVPGWHFYQSIPRNDHGVAVTGALVAIAPGIDLFHYNRSVNTLRAFEAAHRDGADVITMSFSTDSATIPHLVGAIDRAVLSGVVVVASAGNMGILSPYTITAPGPQPLLITVGDGTAGGRLEGTHGDTIYRTSSRGPVRGTYHIKPDIVVTGTSVYTTRQFPDDGISPSAYEWRGGTSHAAPIIAGIAALLLEEFPDATPCEIKARIMNSARPLANLNPNSVFRVGAGFVRPLEALRNQTVVTVIHDISLHADPNVPFAPAAMSSLSFGNAATLLLEHSGSLSMTGTIRNTGDTARTYTIEPQFTANPSNMAQLTLSQQSITVAAEQTADFIATMSLRIGHIPAGFYEGYLYVRDGSTIVARLPFGLVNSTTLSFLPMVALHDGDDILWHGDPDITFGQPLPEYIWDAFEMPRRDNFLYPAMFEGTQWAFWQFNGWYTQPNDNGFRVDKTTPISITMLDNGRFDLYAHWQVRPFGDADGDGMLSSMDSTTIQNYILRISVNICHIAADVDLNGAIRMMDLALVQAFMLDSPVILGGPEAGPFGRMFGFANFDPDDPLFLHALWETLQWAEAQGILCEVEHAVYIEMVRQFLARST